MTDIATPLTATPQADDSARTSRARRLLTYLMLFAIVMFFAGLTSAYVVTRSSVDYWVTIRVPQAFYVSTVAILLSSGLLFLALARVRSGRSAAAGPLLLGTLVLGLVFTWSQFQGWRSLRTLGNYFSFSNVLQPTGEYGRDYTVLYKGSPLERVNGEYFTADDLAHAKPLNADMREQVNAASQYFYVLTAAHLAHLAFGLIALAVMALKAMRGAYTREEHTGLWSGSLYWHFLGGLWVYLLLFLVIIH